MSVKSELFINTIARRISIKSVILLVSFICTPLSVIRAADSEPLATQASISPDDCERLLNELSEVLGGNVHINSIYDVFRLIEAKNRSALPSWLHGLEDSIIEFYSKYRDVQDAKSAAQTRVRFAAFCSRWNFKEDQGLLVLVVYGLKIFERLGNVSGSTEQIKKFLSDFYFQIFLGSDHPAALRYPYYLANVGLKSVPEIARELGVGTGIVYRELYLLRMSTVDVYRSLMLNAANTDAALPSNLSPQFLEFVRHHLHIGAPRGLSWDRHLRYEGKVYHEEQLLAHLHDLGQTQAQIAQTLSVLIPIVDGAETAAELRTESSVGNKLAELGLTTEFRPSFPEEVFDVNYGYLKYKGRLQTEAVWIYLRDHIKSAADELTKRFGISHSTLKRFLIRNRIGFMEHESLMFPGIGKVTKSNDPAWEAQAKEAKIFESAVESTVDWIQRNPRQVPTAIHFRLTPPPGDLSVDITGFSITVIRKAGTASFWTAVKERAKTRDVHFCLIDVRFRDLSEEDAIALRPIWQMEALELTAAFMMDPNNRSADLRHGRWPKGSTHKSSPSSFLMEEGSEQKNVIPIPWSRLVAKRNYAKTAQEGQRYQLRIFESETDFYLALYRYLTLYGVTATDEYRFYRVPINSTAVTSEIQNIWKNEFLEDAQDTIIRNGGRVPGVRELVKMMNVPPDRFVKLSGHENQQSAGEVFSSVSELLRELYEFSGLHPSLAHRGQRIWWVTLRGDVLLAWRNDNAYPGGFRATARREIMELALQAVLDGKEPSDFLDRKQNLFSSMNISWDRITGYRRDTVALFDSLQEFYEVFLTWLDTATPPNELEMAKRPELLDLRHQISLLVSEQQISQWIEFLKNRLRDS